MPWGPLCCPMCTEQMQYRHRRCLHTPGKANDRPARIPADLQEDDLAIQAAASQGLTHMAGLTLLAYVPAVVREDALHPVTVCTVTGHCMAGRQGNGRGAQPHHAKPQARKMSRRGGTKWDLVTFANPSGVQRCRHMTRLRHQIPVARTHR